jgi:hypothetical protein
MNLRSRRRSALFLLGWLLAAAFASPMAEVGDLLESVVTVPPHPHDSAGAARAPVLAMADREGPIAPPGEDEDLWAARYVGLLSHSLGLAPVLAPLGPLPRPARREPLAQRPLGHDFERGPPHSV